jgi:hypothetical protein
MDLMKKKMTIFLNKPMFLTEMAGFCYDGFKIPSRKTHWVYLYHHQAAALIKLFINVFTGNLSGS